MSTAASKSKSEPAPEPEYALSEKKDGGAEVHPPRSMLKNLVLIGTVTLAMILNVSPFRIPVRTRGTHN